LFLLAHISSPCVQDSSGNGFTGALYTTDGYFNTLSGVPNFDAEADSGSTGIQLPTSFVTAFLRANNYTIMLHFNGQAGYALHLISQKNELYLIKRTPES
jgi:hypothetical protein